MLRKVNVTDTDILVKHSNNDKPQIVKTKAKKN